MTFYWTPGTKGLTLYVNIPPFLIFFLRLFVNFCLWKCFGLFFSCFSACCPLIFLKTDNLSSWHQLKSLNLYNLLYNDNINIWTNSQISPSSQAPIVKSQVLLSLLTQDWLEWNNKDFRAWNITSKLFLLIYACSAANWIRLFNKVLSYRRVKALYAE